MSLLLRNIPQAHLAFDKIWRPIILRTERNYYVLGDQSLDKKIAEAAGAKITTPDDLIGSFLVEVPDHLVLGVIHVKTMQQIMRNTAREAYN